MNTKKDRNTFLSDFTNIASPQVTVPEGLSRHDYFAAMALQGMLANPADEAMISQKIKKAIATADVLIADLQDENGEEND